MNLYDFDKTIYNGDSTIDFYVFCIKKNKKIIKYLPAQIISFVKYKIGLIKKNEFKEQFFVFLQGINNIDNLVNAFWKKYYFKIKKWYLENNHENDIIISASPEFLLKKIAIKLKVYDLIATSVNKNSGKLESQNCYGEEKVNMLKQKYKNMKFDKCYTDSLSDIPILNLAKNGYIVKKNKIINS